MGGFIAIRQVVECKLADAEAVLALLLEYSRGVDPLKVHHYPTITSGQRPALRTSSLCSRRSCSETRHHTVPFHNHLTLNRYHAIKHLPSILFAMDFPTELLTMICRYMAKAELKLCRLIHKPFDQQPYLSSSTKSSSLRLVPTSRFLASLYTILALTSRL